jgi:recombination associated protein RdgC
MGAIKGAISVRRYAVLDPLPSSRVRERLVKGLRAHAFLPLDPRSEVDRAVGWVVLGQPEDADLTPEKVLYAASAGEELRVALRVDTLRVPAAEVRRQVALRAAELEVDGRHLSPRERRALREEVTRTLKLRAFPRVRVTDLVWQLDAGRVYFWSQTKAASEAMLDVFMKSFGLRIEVEGPARWSAATVDTRMLDRLEPTRELWLGFDGLRPLGGNVEEA